MIVRQWDTLNPIEQPGSPSVICNTPCKPAADSATVAVGTEVIAYWNSYTYDVSAMAMCMTECPGPACENWDAQGGQWIKVDESGLLSGTVGKGKWGSGQMIANKTQLGIHCSTDIEGWQLPAENGDDCNAFRGTTIPSELCAVEGHWWGKRKPGCVISHSHSWRVYLSQQVIESKRFPFLKMVLTDIDPAWSKPVWSAEQQAKMSCKIPGPTVWKGNWV